MSRPHAALPFLLAAEVAAVGALHVLGRAPSLRIDLREPTRWLSATPPEDAVAAVVRLVTLALAYWVLAGTLAYLGARLTARLTGSRTALRRVRGLALPAVRRVIDRAVTIGVVTGTLSGASAVAQPAGPPRVAPPEVVVVTTDDGALLPPGIVPPARPPARGPRAPTDPRPQPPRGTATSDHRVEPGDNLWDIAAAVVTEHGDPSVARIHRYWRRLIDANLAALRSGDPDLIHPGEVVRLPPVEGPR